MLIIYPAVGWSTFLDIVEAEAFMLSMKDTGDWKTLTPEQKDSLLVNTAAMIRLCKSITLPATNEPDLVAAQAQLLLQAARVDMTVYDPNGKALAEEHAGSVGHRWNTRLKAEHNMGYPPLAELLLSQYGCAGNATNNKFSQTYMGRS